MDNGKVEMMAEVFVVEVAVMVVDPAMPVNLLRDPAMPDDFELIRRNPVDDYFLPDADEKATRAALIKALKGAGFERVNKDLPLESRFSAD